MELQGERGGRGDRGGLGNGVGPDQTVVDLAAVGEEGIGVAVLDWAGHDGGLLKSYGRAYITTRCSINATPAKPLFMRVL